MTLEFVGGDILNTSANIIVQSVNHRGVMGAGLAKQIRNKYPDIVNGYVSACSNNTFRWIMKEGYVYWWSVFEPDGTVKQIASIFGQENYGTDRRHTNYVSLINGLVSVFEHAEYAGYSVAIPFGIGCGLGGGSWDVVMALMNDALKYYPTIKVYIYKNSPLDR